MIKTSSTIRRAKNRSALKNAIATLSVLGMLAVPTAVMAVTASGCAAAKKSCYGKWYMPDWGCDNLYEDCIANATPG